jgi:hypothetical protein
MLCSTACSLLSGRAGGRCECATHRLVPARSPVLFLACVAAVPGGLALRANFELLQVAYKVATVVEAMLSPHEFRSAKHVELVDWIIPPLPQPMYPAGRRHPWERRAPP